MTKTKLRTFIEEYYPIEFEFHILNQSLTEKCDHKINENDSLTVIRFKFKLFLRYKNVILT